MSEQVGSCVAWICTTCGAEGLKKRAGDPASHDCSRSQRICDAEAAVIAAAEVVKDVCGLSRNRRQQAEIDLVAAVNAYHEARKP